MTNSPQQLREDFLEAWNKEFIKGNGPYWPDVDAVADYWLKVVESEREEAARTEALFFKNILDGVDIADRELIRRGLLNEPTTQTIRLALVSRHPFLLSSDSPILESGALQGKVVDWNDETRKAAGEVGKIIERNESGGALETKQK